MCTAQDEALMGQKARATGRFVARGRCTSCGYRYPLRKDGTTIHHVVWHGVHFDICPGAHRIPRRVHTDRGAAPMSPDTPQPQDDGAR